MFRLGYRQIEENNHTYNAWVGWVLAQYNTIIYKQGGSLHSLPAVAKQLHHVEQLWLYVQKFNYTR